MHKLIKMSSPGWVKSFNTEEEVEATLSAHVCPYCKANHGTTLKQMLSSHCGCEFGYIGPKDVDPMSEAEYWDIKLNRNSPK